MAVQARFGNALLVLALAALSISLSSYANSGVLATNVTDNVITQWNAVAQRVVRRVGLPNQIATRTYSFVALSQYKALQLAYKEGLAIPEVAAVYAAHYVLSEVFDGTQTWAKFRPAPPGSPAGEYQFLPNQTFALYPRLGSAEPFVIKNAEDWDTDGPPPKIPSAQYDSDYHISATVGNALSSLQTPYEKETSKFYEDGANTSAATGQLFNVKLAIMGSLSLKDTAKLFTKLAVGAYDAPIVIFYLKYKYKFWRPYTAVTQGDSKHSPNPNFATVISTPPHPDYPSGHSGSGGAFAFAVSNFLGIQHPTALLRYPQRATSCRRGPSGLSKI